MNRYSQVNRVHKVLFVITLSLWPMPGHSQTSISSTGTPQNSAFFPVEHGFVNLGNGDVHLEIPIANIPQRGDLSLPATLVYDSSIWEVSNGLYALQWSPTAPGGGWSIQYDRDYGSMASTQAIPCPSNASLTVYVYSAVQWTDAQGTQHVFPIQTVDTNSCSTTSYTDTPTAQGFATDGSGYYATVSGYVDLNVWDSRGTLVVSTTINSSGTSDAADVDRNGNQIQYAIAGVVSSDSMAHTPIRETVASSDSTGNPSLIYLDVPIVQGQTARYSIQYENVPVATNFNISASKFISGETINVEEYNANIHVIQSITLPDGTAYHFGYDSYGLLNNVTLPQGGTVTYSYSNDSGAGTTTPPRWASSHSGSDGPTTFAYANQGSYTPTSETGGYSCSKIQNTAAGAVLTQTYVFSSCNGSIQPMKILQSPTSNPSAVDKFTLFSYDFSHPCASGACTGAQWIAMTGTTTVLPSSGTVSSILSGAGGSGLISDVQMTYATPGSGKVSSLKQWDFYSGTYPTSLPDSPSGGPKHETDTTYGYTVNHALFPTAIVMKNAAGSIVSETDYTYDEASYFVASPSGVPNHSNSLAASTRGNITTITQVPHGSGSAPTLIRHLTYDDTGAVVATQDAKGYITTLAHDATDTFTQTVTRPATTGLPGHTITHATTTTQDFNTGQVLSVTDENGQVTSNQYDSVGRLSSTQFSNGGSPVTLKTYSYPSANETDASTLQVQDAYETASIPTSTFVDGFGRVTQAVQAGVSTETTYDAQGRVYSVTNGHTSSTNTTDGTSYYTYDELGRLHQVTPAGAGNTTYSYSLNTVTITDPLSHQRSQTYDAFGNLAIVMEPDSSNSLTWQTAYTRNDLGLLAEIDQKGGSTDPSQWRSRYFNYDGLGRLSSQITQEAGQYTYTYDNNGNILTFANQNTSANTVNFTYDALNRPLTKQVGGGPTYTYTYDAQDSSGDLYGIGRLTSTSDGSSVQARYTHDPLGRVVSEADCRPSSCSFGYQMSANLDFQGNLRLLNYPDGRRIEWVYDLFNRPTDEINTFFGADEIDVPFMVGATYFPTGQLQDVIDGSGVELTTSFDPKGDLTSATYNNGSPIVNRTYSWASNGTNLIGVTDSASGRTQAFTYDQLDRLQTATDTGTTVSASNTTIPSIPSSSMSYSYDAWGNMQQSGTYSFIQPFGANNRPTCSGCAFDAAGNQTGDAFGDTFSYRADGHQTSSSGTNYSYDALDQRVVKSGTSTKEYFFFGGQLIATRDASTGAWNDLFYGANGLLGEVVGTEDANPKYRVGDHLDTLAQTTDVNGNVVGAATSLPYGQILSNTTGDSFVFTDHEWDGENLTSNTTFRQYFPSEGRWLAPDPYAGSYNMFNPQSLNRYAYVMNSPLSAIDFWGLDACGTYGYNGSYAYGTVCNPQPPGASGGVGASPGQFDGFGYTFLGGGLAITNISSNGVIDSTYSARQNFTYAGPGLNQYRDLDSTSPGCRYVDPFSAAFDLTFKFGPAFEAADLNVGLNMFTKTLGEPGVGSSFDLGFKGIIAIQGKRSNAWASDPLSWNATFLGFNKDLGTPMWSSSGWKFQPLKEFRFGFQALGGFEVGLNTERYSKTVEQNRACGYTP